MRGLAVTRWVDGSFTVVVGPERASCLVLVEPGWGVTVALKLDPRKRHPDAWSGREPEVEPPFARGKGA